MQRIDAGYLYELGDAIRCVRSFRLRDVPAYEIWQPLANCRQKLSGFLQTSIYANSLRPIVHHTANSFITSIDNLTHRIVSGSLETVTSGDQIEVQQAYERFEPVLGAELSSHVFFHVQPQGVYDVLALVEQGSQLFPQSVHWKAPDAVRDIEEGAKALAFELWSAAAFHFHRANEAVLRRYYDSIYGSGKRPKICTMGTMLQKMSADKMGDDQILIALQSLTKFHRNPNIHPGDFIEDSEQAFSLVAALRAAMGYMLDNLPFTDEVAALIDQDEADSDAPPLIHQA